MTWLAKRGGLTRYLPPTAPATFASPIWRNLRGCCGSTGSLIHMLSACTCRRYLYLCYPLPASCHACTPPCLTAFLPGRTERRVGWRARHVTCAEISAGYHKRCACSTGTLASDGGAGRAGMPRCFPRHHAFLMLQPYSKANIAAGSWGHHFAWLGMILATSVGWWRAACRLSLAAGGRSIHDGYAATGHTPARRPATTTATTAARAPPAAAELRGGRGWPAATSWAA